jgi:hypothetical protein
VREREKLRERARERKKGEALTVRKALESDNMFAIGKTISIGFPLSILSFIYLFSLSVFQYKIVSKRGKLPAEP